MPRASVASKLLARHKPDRRARCMACREPHAAKLSELLDCATEAGEPVTYHQLHAALEEWSGYSNGPSALRRHLVCHDVERWSRLNLQRRPHG